MVNPQFPNQSHVHRGLPIPKGMFINNAYYFGIDVKIILYKQVRQVCQYILHVKNWTYAYKRIHDETYLIELVSVFDYRRKR